MLGWVFLGFVAALCLANVMLLIQALIVQVKTKWRERKASKRKKQLEKEKEQMKKQKEEEKKREKEIVRTKQ